MAFAESVWTLNKGEMMMSGSGIAGVFNSHVARIKRIVTEEYSGCSAVFDQSAWPLISFQVQDAHGTILSRTTPPFSIAELEEFTDSKLRSAIRGLCEFSNSK